MALSPAERTGPAARLRTALPSWPVALVGSLAWAVLMGASAALGLALRAWETGDLIVAVVALFAAGGAAGFAPGLFLARLAAGGKPRGAAFAAVFLGLSLATIGFTAAIYALVYRSYYAAWHADAFTITWMFQQLFTTLGALGQFAVLGLRLYFPLGFAALVAAGLLFSRPPR
jgi:hypothetical protein